MDLSRLPLMICNSSNCRDVTGPVCPSNVRWGWPVRTTFEVGYFTIHQDICMHRLTVPHPDCAVTASAHKGVAPELHSADKVLVHFPCAVSVGRRRDREATRGSRSTGEEVSGKSIARRRRWRMRDCPKNVHGHDTLPGGEVPLSHSLV